MATVILIIAALHMLLMGMKIDVGNFTSFVIFKFPAVVLGIFVLLIAVAQWQHWPIVGVG